MLDTSKPTLILACAAPGAGKTTWWKEGLKNGSIPQQSIRINMDEIRYELTGNESDQSKNHVVAKMAESKLKNCLSERIPVIYWDNTNTQAKYRKPLVQLGKSAGYNVICVYWNLPLTEHLSRNKKRNRVVPDEVIEKMHNNISQNPPSKNEGFDDIIVINS